MNSIRSDTMFLEEVNNNADEPVVSRDQDINVPTDSKSAPTHEELSWQDGSYMLDRFFFNVFMFVIVVSTLSYLVIIFSQYSF